MTSLVMAVLWAGLAVGSLQPNKQIRLPLMAGPLVMMFLVVVHGIQR